MAESGADIEAAIRSFVGQERVFVVHFRNIHRHPDEHLHYDETFIDEGDMDMIATLQLYQQLGYSGLMDPDHAPVMEGDGHFVRERGYAYALGYMRAVQQQWQRDAAAEEPA
jgi:mannonate dehydratase